MMGRQKKRAEKLFYYGFRLEERIPGDHLLRRIEEAVDFGFVRRSVGETYGYNGHESEDPIVIVKLMLLLFLEGVKSERELMRVLPMRLDWLWFLELDLDSEVANHSVLSKARARWGAGVFEELFVRVVQACVEAGLVSGDKIHVDGSLVDADASRDSVSKREIRRVYVQQAQKLTRLEVESGGKVLESRTDPDAAVVRRGRADVSRPRYKHHRAVDDAHGVVTAVHTTSGDGHEADELEELIEGHEKSTGESVETVVGDFQYGTNENYRLCAKREIHCHLGDVKSKMKMERASEVYPVEAFEYHAAEDHCVCPAGEILKRYASRELDKRGYAEYRIGARYCGPCERKVECTRSKSGRRLKRPLGYEAIQRGRKQSHSAAAQWDRRRRKHLIEGSFADAANQHHFKRSRWRGSKKQPIQDYLIAVCQNLRILYSKGAYLPVKERALVQRSSCVRSFGPFLRLSTAGRHGFSLCMARFKSFLVKASDHFDTTTCPPQLY